MMIIKKKAQSRERVFPFFSFFSVEHAEPAQFYEIVCADIDESRQSEYGTAERRVSP
jgi:hypothetical protein